MGGSSEGFRNRWLACGNSNEADAFAAGATATRAAVQGRDDAKLLVVFCSEAYDLDVLLKGIASEAPRHR